MHSRIPEAICCIFLCAVCAAAAEPVTSNLEPKAEIIWDDELARLESMEAPDSVRILQLLDLPDNKSKFDDKTLERLERFQELRTLVVICPNMTDKSLKSIAKLRHLECLIIYQCEVTDDGLDDLKVLSKLQTVGLFKTGVTDEGIAKLKMALGRTYFELGSFGKTGKVFDANGCMRSSVARQHFKVPKDLPK